MSALRHRSAQPRSANLLIGLPALTLAAALATQIPLKAFASTPIFYGGPDQGLWSNPANWSPNLVPNNNSSQTFQAIFNTPTVHVLLDTSVTIDSLQLNPFTTLAIQSNTLTIAGGSLTNAGTLLLNNSTSTLSFSTNATLSSQGSLLLGSTGSKITGTSGIRLFSDNNISGQGAISGISITNSATISATSGLLSISVPNAADSFINTGNLLANGGTLSLLQGSYTNTAGLIAAMPNSTLTSLASSIVGGTIAGLGGTLMLNGNPLIQNLTLAGQISVLSTSVPGVNISGTVNNTGTITLLPFLSSTTTFGGSGTLTGGGTILMNSTRSVFGGTQFDQITSDNIISGQGTMQGASLTNLGTITATTHTLTMSHGTVTNSGLLSANGGLLIINPTSLINTGGFVQAVNNSNISIGASNIQGGTLDGSGGTITLTSTKLTLNGVSLLGTITGPPGFSTLTLGGVLANAGRWTITTFASVFATGAAINNTGTLTLAARFYTGLAITGGGTIIPSNFSASSFSSDNLMFGNGELFFTGSCVNSGTIAANTGLLSLAQSTSGTTSFLNTGLILASSGTLALNNGLFSNNGTIQASNNSLLVIGGTRIQFALQPATTVTGGVIQALAGGTVSLHGTISGNFLRSDATGSLYIDNLTTLPANGSASATISQLDNAGTLLVETGSTVFLAGTPSNTGVIRLSNFVGASSIAGVYVLPGTTLSGGGTLDMGHGSSNFISPSNPLQLDSTSFVTDNLITGTGIIGPTSTTSTPTGFILINNGTISATPVAAAALAVRSDSLINGGSLRASGGTLSLTGDAITNNGAIEALASGRVLLNINVAGGTLRASDGGTIAFSTISHTASVSSLQLTSNTAGSFTATLDLAASKLTLKSTDPTDKQSKISQLTAAINSGSGAGTWTGKGLTSSTAAADPAHYAVALFDNAMLQLQSFGNQPVDANSLLISIAHLGDASGNGIVDIQDQSIITNNWQKPATNWANGDLNLDGFVDIQDLTIVTNNWQQQSAFSQDSGLTTQDSAPAPTPEPASLLLLSFPLLLLHRRTRPRFRHSSI